MTDSLPMTKDALIDQEERWYHVADTKGYQCERCGNTPPFSERELYFETDLCGWCHHQMTKDD